MEGANVVFVPGLALWFGWPRSPTEIAAMVISIFAAAGLLIVGTVFWRAVDRRLKSKDHGAIGGAVQFAAAAQRPMALFTGASIIAALIALSRDGASSAVIAAGALSLLAVLEYVNYYHLQLQVFDNAADMRRLLSTGRLKRSHLARDRAARRQGSAERR
jgi:hypothetical protein